MTLIVTEDDAGKRCDRFVVEKCPEFSRAQVQRWLETGAIIVNGKPIKASAKLRSGDVLDVTPPPVAPSRLLAEDIPLDIIFEDSDLIVINKSPDMVVHPGAGRQTGTLVHALLAHCGDLTGVGDEERPGIVHRLDKGTSGVMVVAKSDQVHRALQAQFQSRDIGKEYLAVAHGVPKGRAGVWDAPIGRHPVQRKKMAAVIGGRHALTRWEVVEHFGRVATLFHLFLHTGRTHQIRVHASHAGHPLVGDAVYGGGRRTIAGFARPALHAYRLTLTHPRRNEKMEWTAPLPPDMAALLKSLREENADD